MYRVSSRDTWSTPALVLGYVVAIAVYLGVGLLLVGCSAKTGRPVVPKEVTKLPDKPRSAQTQCETLTDDEIIKCIKDPKSRDMCEKLELSCARYDNLKEFVNKTWQEKSGT